ncbi:tetratricopeptide repeat protein [Saccharicrinis sp. FJH2]|uniref:tetratricopeptide repeat protein n=1 Tax=Saccharicrinis sp. FJH65 TaxID=3344659 RepID=UPI0035F42E1F
MKTPLLLFVFLLTMFGCKNTSKKSETKHDSETITSLDMQILRMSMQGPVSLNFNTDGTVDVDFGNDSTVEVTSLYSVQGDTIIFTDKDGISCPGPGIYTMNKNDYYVSFDLIDDTCGGRVKSTMGFWVYPDFTEKLQHLNEQLAEEAPEPDLYLDRARIYMATANPQMARNDFSTYLDIDSANARVYINRAGTWFPDKLNEAIVDCNKAIELEPDNKNAYFLRGLAKYTTGNEEEGCADFKKAIEQGFTVLKVAEKERCKGYW